MRRAILCSLFFVGLIQAAPLSSAQDDPPREEPALPAGLLQEEEEEPALPPGLSGMGELSGVEETAGESESDGADFFEKLPFDLSGFLDLRAGYRTRDDRYEKEMSLGEGRLQLELEKQWTEAAFHLTADFFYDHVTDRHDNRLEKGEGWLDLREASFSFTPTGSWDMKVGRQILTWGTGDLFFINDLFSKDWNSFFIGRDEEYLKAPSDAVKGSFFWDFVSLDVVYTPRFDSDRYIDGRRISFWNANLGRRSGRDLPIHADLSDDWLKDDEVALRLFRNLAGYEIALYGYHGFWKSPAGQDPVTGRALFPELSVFGASVRGNLARGIGNLEAGYYYSGDDAGGGNPMTRNCEIRFLAGYEQEAWTDFTTGVQYYLEWMMDYGDYRRNLPAAMNDADERRHVLTLRLTQLLMNQNLALSLFTFYSPSDADAFTRPNIHYKVDDNLALEVGANLWFGRDKHTFFGQFDRNTNVYAGVRYSF
jgi:hypothetical protein